MRTLLLTTLVLIGLLSISTILASATSASDSWTGTITFNTPRKTLTKETRPQPGTVAFKQLTISHRLVYDVNNGQVKKNEYYYAKIYEVITGSVGCAVLRSEHTQIQEIRAIDVEQSNIKNIRGIYAAKFTTAIPLNVSTLDRRFEAYIKFCGLTPPPPFRKTTKVLRPSVAGRFIRDLVLGPVRKGRLSGRDQWTTRPTDQSGVPGVWVNYAIWNLGGSGTRYP